METKAIKSLRTRLSKKSFKDLLEIAVKQYISIKKLKGIKAANNKKIIGLVAKITNLVNKSDKTDIEIEKLRIRVENAEKTNTELYVKINEKDATINKLQIAVYSMAIVICGLIVYIIC